MDNDYPLYLVDSIIKNILDYHVEGHPAESETDNVKLHVNLDNPASFNKDRKTLYQTVKEHVKSCNLSKKIKLCGYYQPLRLSSMFSTRRKPSEGETTRCVYQYNCYEEGCQASYVGFTSCRLNRRTRGHRHEKSVIYKHFYAENLAPMYPIPNFESNFKNFFKRYHDIVKRKGS